MQCVRVSIVLVVVWLLSCVSPFFLSAALSLASPFFGDAGVGSFGLVMFYDTPPPHPPPPFEYALCFARLSNVEQP